MNRQIWASQDKLLRRFFDDHEYAERMAHKALHSCIADWLPPDRGTHVLELGCGPGKYVAMLSTLGYRVTGVDPIRYPTWDTLCTRESVVLMDKVFAESLPFPDASFDHVTCLGALLYFDDPAAALNEMRRVIRPGGRAVIRTVNRTTHFTLRTGKKFDPASKTLYTLGELVEAMRRAGFEVAESFSYGYRPPMWPNLWWYIECVWLTPGMQDLLSSWLKPEHRIQNSVFVAAPPCGSL